MRCVKKYRPRANIFNDTLRYIRYEMAENSKKSDKK